MNWARVRPWRLRSSGDRERACLAVRRGPKRKDTDLRSLGGGAHDFPGLLTANRSKSATVCPPPCERSREKNRVVICEPVLLGPEQLRSRQVQLTGS
jgi:hypothetical protein